MGVMFMFVVVFSSFRFVMIMKRLEWLGHVTRMDQRRVIKTSLKASQKGEEK
jgi:hypothetical protein